MEIREEIESHDKLEDSISRVLSLNYKSAMTEIYEEKLTNLKQETYPLILDYVFEIQEICKRLSVCTKKTKSEMQSIQDRTLFRGLHRLTRLKIFE